MEDADEAFGAPQLGDQMSNQQQQLAMIADDQVTNCSETMSTNDELDGYATNNQQIGQLNDEHHQQQQPEQQQQQPPQRTCDLNGIQFNNERLAPEQVAGEQMSDTPTNNNNGNMPLQLQSTMHSAGGALNLSPESAQPSTQTTQCDELETTTLSLMSANHAPPSYGTATRILPALGGPQTLDARQLMRQSGGSIQFAAPSALRFPTDHQAPGERAEENLAPLLSLNMQYAPSSSQPNGHFNYSSAAQSFDSGSQLTNTIATAMAGATTRINLAGCPDNNQVSMLDQQPASGASQVVGGSASPFVGPINHVISGCESMQRQWQSRQQQQQLQTSIAAAAANQLGAQLCGLGSLARPKLASGAPGAQMVARQPQLHNQLIGRGALQSQQQQQHLHNHREPQQPPAFGVTLQHQHQRQQSGPNPNAQFPTATTTMISRQKHETMRNELPTNLTTNEAHQQTQRQQMTNPSSISMAAGAHNNASASHSRAPSSTTGGQTANSEQPRRQQHHRKLRRRHRSAVTGAGERSVSPSAARYYTMAAASTAAAAAGGTAAGSSAGSGGNNQLAAHRVRTKATGGSSNAISAHCWLIDSSDTEKDTRRNRRHRQSPYLSSTIDSRRRRGHLTVAMARQTEQQQAARHQSPAMRMSSSQSVASTLARHTFSHSDMTSNLKSNSLKMERILSRQTNYAAETPDDSSESTSSCATSSPPSTFHSDHEEGAELQCDSRFRKGEARSRATRAKRQIAEPNQGANTLVRLSALLSVVSNLVRRGPKCLSSKVSARRSQSSCTIPIDELQPGGSFAAASVYRLDHQLDDQPNRQNHVLLSNKRDLELQEQGQKRNGIISVPASCHNGNSILGSGHAAYTAASLAISSSSSTSAYATGGSSSNRSAAGGQLAGHEIRMKQPKQNSTGGSTGGSSSMFYSSSLNSTQGQPHSVHAYEYCYDNQVATLSEKQELDLQQQEEETQFMGSQQQRQHQQQQRQPEADGAKPTSSQSNLSSETTSSSSITSGAREGVTMNLNARQEYRLAAQVMSDHELISAASDSHLATSRPMMGSVQVPMSSLASGQVPARQRWWWNSLTFMRPCRGARSSNSDLSSEPADARTVCGAANSLRENSIEATRYKSLRGTTNFKGSAVEANQARQTAPTLNDLDKASRRATKRTSARDKRAARGANERQNRDNRDEDRCTSTLDNVISLAKVDRVFRYRLLASIIVSLILFTLICLLIGLIYSKSIRMYQRNKFSLLIDDSDYDLSWLWPQQQQHQFNSKSPYDLQALGDEIKRKSQWKFQGQIDDTMRGHLLVIERSERLNQFQQTIAHLTNIQLANNDYVDLTQISDQLLGFQPSDFQLTSANRTKLSIDSSNSPADETLASSASRKPNYLPRLTEIDQDLIGLTLLSNLYWPLVKWRQQTSQKSFANIFSFAMSPIVTFNLPGENSKETSRPPSQQVGIRNLLSMLMLAESEPELLRSLPTSNSYDLQQFIRMSNLIRRSSHHLVSCSNVQLRLDHKRVARSSDVLKRKFCHLLTRRYHRMMLTLSQLDHRHLAELYDQLEIPSSFLDPNQFKSRQSKTLLGFFLDRLALLDPNLIAEMVIAEADELDLPLDELESGKTIDLLLRHDTLPNAGGHANADVSNEERTSENQDKLTLIELTRSIVGDDPLRFNLEADKSSRELHAMRMQQLKQEHPSKWRDEMSRDLLNPWISHQLPPFIQPQIYDLFIHPNLTNRLLLGMTKIEFTLERPTRYLVLNCDQLNLVELTLWFRVPASGPTSSSLTNDSRSASQNNGGDLSGSEDSVSRNGLKQVALKRVIQNHKFKQIFIELRDTIVPLSSQINGASGEPKLNSLDFGELPLHGEFSNSHPSTGQTQMVGHNRFLLNLSFNKTNLMTTASEQLDIVNEDQDDEQNGLVFVQYADYFAQPEAEVKTMLYTQFEPRNARQVFPCFDQPNLKAKFQLNLVHEQQHQVLFNSLKREKVPYTSDGSKQMSVFEETPIPISTHLVAFMVGDNQNIKSITSRLVQLQSLKLQQRQQKIFNQANQLKDLKYIQVQILSQFEHIGQAEFASQLVPQLLAFYQTHLQQSYPMEKLDLVAIPQSQTQELQLQQQQQQQQQIDSVDSFGLLLFKSQLLLLDSNLISQNSIEQISATISHQLAHQYFGNLVTIRRWPDLWLYEGLCQYLESISLTSVQLDWRLDEQFPVNSIREALTSRQVDSGAPFVDNPDNMAGARSQLASAPIIEDPVTSSSGGGGVVVVSGDMGDLPEVASDQSELTSGQTKQIGELAINGQTNPSVGNGAEANTNGNRGSAVLHMLMFNLLPSTEAQARLLRRCLAAYRFRTMSSLQFWRQFGEQLTLEGSHEQLQLDVSKFIQRHALLGHSINGNVSLFRPTDDLQPEGLAHLRNSRQASDAQSNERVVFVRTGSKSNEAFESSEQIAASNDLEPNEIDLQSNRMRSSIRLADNLDVVASIWLERRGSPVVTVHTYRDRIHLKQDRLSPAWSKHNFELDQQTSEQTVDQVTGTQVPADANKQHEVWPIPLMFVSRFNPKWPKFFWMSSREMELPFSGGGGGGGGGGDQDQSYSSLKMTSNSFSPPWFKLNVNQTSLVRVNYDDRNWESLTDLLSKSHYSNHLLNPLDRANLLDDALTLMRMGKLSVGLTMNLTLYLEVGEREFAPWSVVLGHFDHLQTLLNQNPLWHRYVLKLMQPISSVIGWKDDGPHLMRKLRRQLFSLALQMGDDKTVTKAKQEFKNWFKSNRFIVPNLQELVYVAGVRYGDQQEWFHCWHKYQQLVAMESPPVSNRASNDQPTRGARQPQVVGHPMLPSGAVNSANLQPLALVDANGDSYGGSSGENEKRQLLTALASTQNTWLLEQFLNYSIDSTKIQPHHLKHVMQTLGKNPVARLYLWRFVRLNWNTLIDKYGFVQLDETRQELDTAEEEGRQETANSRGTYQSQQQQILENMILESTKHFATKLDLDEVRVFFDTKRRHHQLMMQKFHQQQQQAIGALSWSANLERAIQSSLEVIRSNIYWRSYIEPKLTRWLSHYDASIIS